MPDWLQLHGLTDLHTHRAPASWARTLKRLVTHMPLLPYLGQRQHPRAPKPSGLGSKDDSNKDQAYKGLVPGLLSRSKGKTPPPHSTPPLLCPSEGSQSPSTAVLATNGPDIAFPTLGGRVVPVQLMRSSSRPNHLVFKTPEDKICFLFLAYKLAKIWAVC